MIDLEPAATDVTRLLAGVTDEHLAAATPCAGWRVGELLDHMMMLTLAFTGAARKTAPPGLEGSPPPVSADRLDPQWRTVLPERLRGLVTAWREPEAWEGETEAGGIRLPASSFGVIALDEVLLHGWDLARATGQPYDPDPASVEAVLGFTSQVAQGPPQDGLFGSPVPVPADAPPLHRALGFAGRDPAWQPS